MAEIDDSRLATLEKGYKLLDELLKSEDDAPTPEFNTKGKRK